ncbi:MAG: alanine racemase [Planctomycetes bacterium]|jgi:alanine racemase|nr:alanine racemase [Planctomycetota bacterium]
MIEQHGTLEIYAARLRANIQTFRSRLAPHVALGATVKANAYGHGLEQIAPLLPNAGISWLCVYSIDEAVAVAALETSLPILVLAPVVMAPEYPDLSPQLDTLLQSRRMRLTVTDKQSASYLSSYWLRRGGKVPLPIHIQVDTGLTRQGVALEQLPALINHVRALSAVRLEGIFMHFSHADQPGHSANQAQLAAFVHATMAERQRDPQLLLHAHNSGGAWHDGFNALNMVRLGIALYGLQPSLAAPITSITPIARLTAPIMAIHTCAVGVGVGYGHTFVTARISRLGVVPVGYADGYPRMLSNRGFVMLGSGRLPVVGRVSMDQMVVDITDSQAGVGDIVTVISDDPSSPIGLDNLAQQCDTIGYELATRLGSRLERKIISDPACSDIADDGFMR